MDKDKIKEMLNEENQLNATTIFTVKRRPKLSVADDDEGLELNEGYEYEVNSSLAELADGIAKFAMELEPQGFGENSGRFFINLINDFYTKSIGGSNE